jgi:hypothetical protein
MMERLLARMDANMETMLAKMDSNKAKVDADTKADRENLKEMREEMNASHKEMLAKMEANGKARREAMKRMMERMMNANQAARLEREEPTSVEMKPEVAHQEVLKEDAAVMTVGEPKKRRRDQNPDARRRGKPKERTQGKDGCRKNLVAARRVMTGSAAVTRRRGEFIMKDRTRNQAERGTPKRRKDKKRLWKQCVTMAQRTRAGDCSYDARGNSEFRVH